MTDDDIIDQLIAHEGGFSNQPNDHGGATNFGITSRDLGIWRGLGRPATLAEVQKLSIEDARKIYRQRYLPPFAAIASPEIRAQLVDIGVLQGTTTALRMLQTVLGVPVDGIVGDRTRAALAMTPWRTVNDLLVAHRCKALVTIVDHDASQNVFLHGWIRRSVSFLS